MKVDVVFDAGKWYAIVCYRVDRPSGPEPDMMAAMNRNRWRWSIAMARPRYTGSLSPRCLTAATGPSCESGSLYRRVRNIGNIWRHRLTRAVASTTRLLVLEKLDPQGMTASATGAVENPAAPTSKLNPG